MRAPCLGVLAMLLLPLHASADWRVRCDRDQVCRLLVDGSRRELPGDADGSRGALRCSERDAWLACAWTHATQLHLNEAYFINLETRRVYIIGLDDLEMRADGTFGTLVGPIRWDGRGVRLVVERGHRRHWIWRRVPGRSGRAPR